MVTGSQDQVEISAKDAEDIVSRWSMKCIFEVGRRMRWLRKLAMSVRVSVLTEGTACMSQKGVMSANPAFIKSITFEESFGLFLHELLHLAFRHFARRKNRKASTWNIACDMSVNCLLESEGVKIPSGGMLPHMKGFQDFLSAEEYYALLDECDDSGSDGDESDSDDDGESGSASDGIERGHEEGQDDMSREIEKNSPVIGDAGSQYSRELVASSQPKRDFMPPRLVPFHNRVFNEINDIRKGFVSPTYRKPSRRPPTGVVNPTWLDPKVRAGIIIDTSGSMPQSSISLVLPVALRAFRDSRVGDVKVAVVSTVVHEVKNFKGYFNVHDLDSTGGTDMRKGFDYFSDGSVDIVFLISDMGTPWHSNDEIRNYPFKTILCYTSSYADYEDMAEEERDKYSDREIEGVPELLAKNLIRVI